MRIPIAAPDITEADVEAVAECVRSTWVSGISPIVKKFEDRYAEWCGVKYGVATGSGTQAGHLALAALDIQQGDEVIIPTFTMVATANIVRYLGATPVLVDCEADTWCIDPAKIEEKITSKTRGILPVHVYGHPADMGSLRTIAYGHDLHLVEDAAEAHGAKWKGRRAGALGDVGFFSFYANKFITMGEGGMLVTDDEDIADKARWLRAHAFGRHGKHYWHDAVGYGYRPSGMQCALGLSQMDRINDYVAIRRMNAFRYKTHLMDLTDEGMITFPVQRPHCENVYWMFSILIEPDFPVSRDKLVQLLADKGVETRTFFYPLHVQPMYHEARSYPISEAIAAKGISLPSGNTLTEEELGYVCDCILEIARG